MVRGPPRPPPLAPPPLPHLLRSWSTPVPLGDNSALNKSNQPSSRSPEGRYKNRKHGPARKGGDEDTTSDTPRHSRLKLFDAICTVLTSWSLKYKCAGLTDNRSTVDFVTVSLLATVGLCSLNYDSVPVGHRIEFVRRKGSQTKRTCIWSSWIRGAEVNLCTLQTGRQWLVRYNVASSS